MGDHKVLEIALLNIFDSARQPHYLSNMVMKLWIFSVVRNYPHQFLGARINKALSCSAFFIKNPFLVIFNFHQMIKAAPRFKSVIFSRPTHPQKRANIWKGSSTSKAWDSTRKSPEIIVLSRPPSSVTLTLAKAELLTPPQWRQAELVPSGGGQKTACRYALRAASNCVVLAPTGLEAPDSVIRHTPRLRSLTTHNN